MVKNDKNNNWKINMSGEKKKNIEVENFSSRDNKKKLTNAFVFTFLHCEEIILIATNSFIDEFFTAFFIHFIIESCNERIAFTFIYR